MTSPTPTKLELLGVFEHLLGPWYPDDFVVATIDAVRGPAALRALGTAGFENDLVHLCDTGEVHAIGRSTGERWTTFHRAGAYLASALAEQEVLAGEYLAEAQSGASIITVLCPYADRVDEAGQVLAAQGARMVRHYGAQIITDPQDC